MEIGWNKYIVWFPNGVWGALEGGGLQKALAEAQAAVVEAEQLEVAVLRLRVWNAGHALRDAMQSHNEALLRQALGNALKGERIVMCQIFPKPFPQLTWHEATN